MSFLEMVREFHARFGFAIGRRVNDYPDSSTWYADKVLRSTATLLKVSQDELDETNQADLRAVRVRLIVEELRELVEALRAKDETAVADGVTDLCYVVVGTAVAFGLPLDELFAEVHRSNMSKTRDGQLKPAKGPDFSPPDLKTVMSRPRT